MFDPQVAHQLFGMLCGHRASREQLEAGVRKWVASKAPRKSQVCGKSAVWYGARVCVVCGGRAATAGLRKWVASEALCWCQVRD